MSVNCKSPRELRIEELADQVRALSAENERLRSAARTARNALSEIVFDNNHTKAALKVIDEALKDG